MPIFIGSFTLLLAATSAKPYAEPKQCEFVTAYEQLGSNKKPTLSRE